VAAPQAAKNDLADRVFAHPRFSVKNAKNYLGT